MSGISKQIEQVEKEIINEKESKIIITFDINRFLEWVTTEGKNYNLDIEKGTYIVTQLLNELSKK